MSEQEQPIKEQEIILKRGDRITIHDKKGEIGEIELVNTYLHKKRGHATLKIHNETGKPIIKLDKDGNAQNPPKNEFSS